MRRVLCGKHCNSEGGTQFWLMTTKWRVYGARIFLASLKKFAGSILLVTRAIWLSSVKRASFSTKPNHSRPPTFLTVVGLQYLHLKKIALGTGNINLVKRQNIIKIPISSVDKVNSSRWRRFYVIYNHHEMASQLPTGHETVSRHLQRLVGIWPAIELHMLMWP